MNPVQVIAKFDEFLSSQNLTFQGVVIGGTALILQKIIVRETIDIDFLDPSIPNEISRAVTEFRNLHPDLELIEKWFNNGPESLKKNLPASWKDNIVEIYHGKVLTLFTLGRLDLLRSKLFAYCDRGIDLQDCIALRPTPEELNICLEWVSEQDGNPLWPNHVHKELVRLGKLLGHE